MPVTPITSNQIVRTADIVCVPMRDAVTTVLVEAPFEGDILQKKIIESGGAFQDFLRPSLEQLIRRALLQFSGVKHTAVDDLEKYVSEVFDGTVSLTGIPFPEKKGFLAYMVRPDGLDEDFALAQIIKRFNVGKYTRMSPVAQHINRKAEQKRPQGTYVFAHVGGDEPDKKHLGKSYDDSIAQKMIFAGGLDYLLMTGYHMWKHEKWMDVKGWTRTSSVWSDGGTVDGCFRSDYRKLGLDGVGRDSRGAFAGPRELFLG